MADTEKENILGFVDKRKVAGATDLPGNLTVDARYMSVGDLRTRLTAIGGVYANTAYLNSMTKNDMVFAVRNSDDAAGI